MMRDPFDRQTHATHSGRQSPSGFTPSGSSNLSDVELWNAANGSLIRNQYPGTAPRDARRDVFNRNSMDPEIAELSSISRSHEEEVMVLRKQIADASVKELQLLKEKHVLERKLADLRMAFDEKQSDSVSDTFREMTQRKGYLEENLRLANDIKVAEEDVYVFTSQLLSLLADYELYPAVLNASTIVNSVKRLYHHMHWKLRSSHDYDMIDAKEQAKFAPSPEMQYPFGSETPREAVDNAIIMDGNSNDAVTRRAPGEFQFYMPTIHETQTSSMSDGDTSFPGIEGFQIIGEAKPGCTLTACGYPTNGTSLCVFQWFRHLQDGTRQLIEGATVPDYVVTADDVDTLLAVDCIPMDDNSNQGELVSLFANNQNKITCDLDMQHEIDTNVYTGRAIFNILLLKESSEEWEPTILVLKRTTYQIKAIHTDLVVLEEKYSADLYIKVPPGHSTQFVLISSDGASLPFSTGGISQPHSMENDLRLRDMMVLTMRIYQAKALDGKKKGKA